MDFFRDEIQHTLNLALVHAGRRDTPGLFNNHGHGNAFVQETEFALFGFGVGGVQVDTTVENGTVDIGDHGADVTRGVGFVAGFEAFDCGFDGLQVVLQLLLLLLVVRMSCVVNNNSNQTYLIPLVGIPLITGIDFLAPILWKGHFLTRMHKLSNRLIETEPMHSLAAKGKDEFDGRTVSDVTGTNTFGATAQQVIRCAVRARFAFVDRENGTDRNVCGGVEQSWEGEG